MERTQFDFCCHYRDPHLFPNGPLARYVQLRIEHALGMPGTFKTPPRVSDPDMHHGTCVTHVPWWISRSLSSGFFGVGGGENVPGTLGASATRNVTYLVRGTWLQMNTTFWMHHIYWEYRYCSDIKCKSAHVASQQCINVFVIKSRGRTPVFVWIKVTKHCRLLCI